MCFLANSKICTACFCLFESGDNRLIAPFFTKSFTFYVHFSPITAARFYVAFISFAIPGAVE